MRQRNGMKFDEAQLRRQIRLMTPRTQFFRVLREELQRLGRWKNLPRGKPGQYQPEDISVD